jgi:hypothetical protein
MVSAPSHSPNRARTAISTAMLSVSVEIPRIHSLSTTRQLGRSGAYCTRHPCLFATWLGGQSDPAASVSRTRCTDKRLSTGLCLHYTPHLHVPTITPHNALSTWPIAALHPHDTCTSSGPERLGLALLPVAKCDEMASWTFKYQGGKQKERTACLKAARLGGVHTSPSAAHNRPSSNHPRPARFRLARLRAFNHFRPRVHRPSSTRRQVRAFSFGLPRPEAKQELSKRATSSTFFGCCSVGWCAFHSNN